MSDLSRYAKLFNKKLKIQENCFINSCSVRIEAQLTFL